MILTTWSGSRVECRGRYGRWLLGWLRFWLYRVQIAYGRAIRPALASWAGPRRRRVKPTSPGSRKFARKIDRAFRHG
jgi:hypothetical protein